MESLTGKADNHLCKDPIRLRLLPSDTAELKKYSRFVFFRKPKYFRKRKKDEYLFQQVSNFNDNGECSDVPREEQNYV